MPDGTSIGHYAKTVQARPLSGPERRSNPRTNTDRGRCFTPADVPPGHEKTPRELQTLAGLFDCRPNRLLFQRLRLWLSQLGGTRNVHREYTPRFNHRQRRYTG